MKLKRNTLAGITFHTRLRPWVSDDDCMFRNLAFCHSSFAFGTTTGTYMLCQPYTWYSTVLGICARLSTACIPASVPVHVLVYCTPSWKALDGNAAIHVDALRHGHSQQVGRATDDSVDTEHIHQGAAGSGQKLRDVTKVVDAHFPLQLSLLLTAHREDAAMDANILHVYACIALTRLATVLQHMIAYPSRRRGKPYHWCGETAHGG